MRSGRHSDRLVLIAAACALAISGCGGDETGGGSCAGGSDGEPVLQGVDGTMQDGNPIRIGSLEPDGDPPTVTFSLKGATRTVQDTATNVQVGASFTFNDVTYEVVGICPDKAYLDATG